MNMIQHIVAEINAQTGESECRYYKERLLYLEDNQRDLLIDSSRILTCHGDLKNNRGAVSYSLSLSLSHTQTHTDTHTHTHTHTGGAHAAAFSLLKCLRERKGLWAQVWLIRVVERTSTCV